ncbi:acetoin utilization AcuB family protein [Bacillus sp. V5-8f]|uniref:acetoin utilization AcuB family protein n=1 Tax=Bacillus sp. V5-8f TaxID=2053044 RepID=UPI000C76C3B3|nr:acetoin utilization AcuB family protein [Bacillus sp. V5-8f]PLT32260.1 acetoin utilization protein AcuB [Bacillus sp. V5-8f]
MIIEEIMATDVTTLTETDTILTAVKLIKEKRIRHIPIVDEHSSLVGLVSDRDIREATPSIFRTEEFKGDLQKPVGMIMKTNVITAHPLDFVEEAASVFYENHISCLPIVKENRLVGIITGTDLLHCYVEMTGAHQPGSQLEVKVPNKAGMLHDVSGILKKRKANILSVLIYPYKDDEAHKVLVLRVQTMNPFMVVEDLKNEGYTVLWPSLPGASS